MKRKNLRIVKEATAKANPESICEVYMFTGEEEEEEDGTC